MPQQFQSSSSSCGDGDGGGFLFSTTTTTTTTTNGRRSTTPTTTTTCLTSTTTTTSSTTRSLSLTTTALYAKKKKQHSNRRGGNAGGGFGSTTKHKHKGAMGQDDTNDNKNDKFPFTPIPKKKDPQPFEFDSLDIQDYLNPKLFETPNTNTNNDNNSGENNNDNPNDNSSGENSSGKNNYLERIQQDLQAGELVVIRNAFRDEFAHAMYRELMATPVETWKRHEAYLEDGYHYRHYNVYNRGDYSDFFNSTFEMFNSPQTKEWISQLSGRDCSGEALGSPSYYGPGDHSLPHTDHAGQRTVAYVCHFSQDWRPEWGGGLYWAPEPSLANAYVHASFNTLVLFSVTPFSSHFVTTVSPHATQPRFSFNGWWQSSWLPRSLQKEEAKEIQHKIDTPRKRMDLSYAQYVALEELLFDPWAPKLPPEVDGNGNGELQTKLEEYMNLHRTESYPPPTSSNSIEL